MKKSLTVLYLLTLVFFGTMAVNSFADDLQLQITSGASTVNIDLGSPSLVYDINDTVGDYAIEAVTGTQGLTDFMDLSSLIVSASNPNAAPLTIELSETGLTTPADSVFEMAIGGVLDPTAATGTYSAYYDTSNTYFGLGANIGTINFAGDPNQGGSFSASQYGSGPGSASGTYSVTEVIQLSGNGTEFSYSGDANLNVPEPSTLILLLAALPSLLFWSFRRNGSKA